MTAFLRDLRVAVRVLLATRSWTLVVLLSLALANARAVAADFGAPPILLFDEVAAHLDADRRAALFDRLVDLGAQAWLTGTDRALFAALGDRAAFVAVAEEGGASRLAPG